MWASKEKTWSQAFLAETVETGHKYCDVTYNILFERRQAFLEWVGPRILSLQSVDYFRTSEYFSGQKKKRIFMNKSSAKQDGEANWSYVVNFVHCGQMSLVMSMQFFSGDD